MDIKHDAITQKAAAIFNVPIEKVTPAQRRYAKIKNYCDNYGVVGKLTEFKHGTDTKQ